jgi:hypothetical protein
VTDINSKSPAATVAEAVTAALHDTGHLPLGSFVDSYVVLVNVVDIDGNERHMWIPSGDLRGSTHRWLVEKMRDELLGS